MPAVRWWAPLIQVASLVSARNVWPLGKWELARIVRYTVIE